MSKIGDLIIQAEECQNNAERLKEFKEKWEKYQRERGPEPWWAEMDSDEDYIKQHEPEGDS